MASSEVELVVRTVTDQESVLDVVTEALREAIGTEQVAATPLYEHVDPDLLEWVLNGSNNDVRVTFTHEGCEVVARGDGTIVVVSAGDSRATGDGWTDMDSRERSGDRFSN